MTIKKDDIRRRYWDQALLAAFAIYLTIPLALPLTGFLKKFIPLNFFINAVIAAILTVSAVLFFRYVKAKRVSTYILIALVGAGYLSVMILPKIPVEKVHCVEYGFLSFLFFRALRLDFDDLKAYFFALAATGLCGWLDEGIQYLMPGRFYDLKDVFLNLYGGALGLLATYCVQRETGRKPTIP